MKHWLVKAKDGGLIKLIGEVPNGTGADFWSWQERLYIEGKVSIPQAVFYGPERTSKVVLNQPNIISVEECTDPEKCYKLPPF